MAEKEYKEITEKKWSDKAWKDFDVVEEDRVLIISGPCPRCRHFMVHKHPLTVFVKMAVFMEQDITMQCSCEFTHPKSAGKKGCGAYWVLNVAVEGE